MLRGALGTFGMLWQIIDEATKMDQSRPVRLPLGNMKTMCEQTSLLLEQAANSVLYLRRKSLLSNITSEKTSKSLLFEREDQYNEAIPEKCGTRSATRARRWRGWCTQFAKTNSPFERGQGPVQ